jgi:transcription termination/antitermination protein NusG
VRGLSPPGQNPLLPLLAVRDNAAMHQEPPSHHFSKGDRVRINDGTFSGFVGVIAEVNELNGRVAVVIQVPEACGSTPVQLEGRQIELA